jgi:hypothetical protein
MSKPALHKLARIRLYLQTANVPASDDLRPRYMAVGICNRIIQGIEQIEQMKQAMKKGKGQ